MNTLYDTDAYTAEKELPMFELNTQSVDHSMSSMCFIKHALVLFLPKTGSKIIIYKIIYNLGVSTENQEELVKKYDDNMMNNLFKNVISILAYIKRLDSKIDSLIQNNNNVQINQTFNNNFEKIFPLKNVEAVDDMENKLKLDENTSGQLVFMILL